MPLEEAARVAFPERRTVRKTIASPYGNRGFGSDASARSFRMREGELTSFKNLFANGHLA